MTESLKRSYSSMASEDVSDEDSDSVHLAPPPPPPKRQKVDEVNASAEQRAAKIKELKTLRINHPDLKIGLTAQLDAELNALTDTELQTLSDNYHLELTEAQPFATGRAATNIIGKVFERVLQAPGFTTSLMEDTHFVANLDQSLPFTFVHYGPQLQAVLSLGTHVINAISAWPTTSTTQLPKSNLPAESLL